MPPVSIIDIGTQSVLHLLACADSGGRLITAGSQMRSVRLGEGLAAEGGIGPKALERLFPVLKEYLREARKAGAEPVRAVGTRVFRAAANRQQVLSLICEKTGIDVEVLSEETEAVMAYHGAAGSLPHSADTAVIDIGGGSTELVRGRASAVCGWQSIGWGAVTLTETGRTDALSIGRCADVDRTLVDADVLLGTGGTITSLAALDLGLENYRAEAVDGHRLSRDRLSGLIARLRELNPAQPEGWACIEPERRDILPAGAMLLAHVMDTGGFSSVTVSDRGLRYGIAMRELGML